MPCALKKKGEKTSMQKLKEFVIKNKISIIVVALLLVVSILTVSIRLATREEGEKIIVTIAGEQVAEYYLNVDGVYSLNGGTNELTVKDGVAYMSASSCPGHDCEKQGKAKYVGQVIICAPYDIFVHIVEGEGSSDTNGGVDFVS
jgi:hypothetical protein